ncbi:hypothetical protein [Lamprocystis purpurea]
MAVLTFSGRTALAVAIKEQPLHFAWGRGDPAWDLTPVGVAPTATALIDEIGRVLPAVVGYCVPDAAGSILVPTGQYAPSALPTNYLHLRFDFNYADAAGNTVREAGLFMGSVMVTGLPAGQRYFPPDAVAAPGILLAVERFPGIVRTAQVRQLFDFVLEL